MNTCSLPPVPACRSTAHQICSRHRWGGVATQDLFSDYAQVLVQSFAARTCRASTAAWMAAPAQESATCVAANILGMLSSKASTCKCCIEIVLAQSGGKVMCKPRPVCLGHVLHIGAQSTGE